MTKKEAENFQLQPEPTHRPARRYITDMVFKLHSEGAVANVLGMLGVHNMEPYLKDWREARESTNFIKLRDGRPPTTDYVLIRKHYGKARHWYDAQVLMESQNE